MVLIKRIIGREKELEQFAKVLEEPKGQAVVIVGEAGSGKSALLEEMLKGAKASKVWKCDTRGFLVRPKPPVTELIRNIGEWRLGNDMGKVREAMGEGRVSYTPQNFKKILEASLRGSEDDVRVVIGIDLDVNIGNRHRIDNWTDIVGNIPEKVKVIITQRPDDVLVKSKMFMDLPSVVRIPEGVLEAVVQEPVKADGQGNYGEGKYGEGVYGGENNVEAIIEQARKALKNKEYSKAIELCDKALSVSPGNVKALAIKGVSYNRGGKYDEEVEQYDMILKKDPEDVGALHGKGMALLNKGDDSAYEVFELLAKLEPENIVPWWGKGKVLFNREAFDEAVKCFDEAIKRNPYDSSSWVMKGKALSRNGKHENAISCFDEALKEASNKAYVLLEMGIAYRAMGNKDAEMQCYDQAIEEDPKYIQTYMQKAHVLSQNEDFEAAIECLTKGISQELPPEKEAVLWHTLATTYLSTGDYREAYKSINRSVELNDTEQTRMVRDAIRNDLVLKEGPKAAVEDAEPVDEEFGLRAKFEEFLVKKKHVPKSALSPKRATVRIRGRVTLNLLAIKGEDISKLAMIDFSPAMDGRGISNSNKRMRKYLVDSKLENCAAYIVCQAKYQKEYPFDIYQVTETDKPEPISYDDFPNYHLLRFTHGMKIQGRAIVTGMMGYAEDLNLKINVTSADWINLKSGGRTVAQVHRYGQLGTHVGLALAGYVETYPSLPVEFVEKGQIEELSGYRSGVQTEINWLTGNIGHEELKYPASVYVVVTEFHNFPEGVDEIKLLLEWAKEKAGREKGGAEDKQIVDKGGPELQGKVGFAKIEEGPGRVAGVVGQVPTISIEGIGEKDCLGRDKLVKTLAGMFAQTECDNGFTMALLGDWGQGKSTVMGLLENELRQNKKKFDFAKYNAWEFEKADNIAAGIAQEAVKGLKRGFCGIHQIILAICFNVIENRWNLCKLLFFGIISWILYKCFGLHDFSVKGDDLLKGLLKTAPLGFTVVSTLFYLGKMIIDFFAHPLPRNLEKYFKLPNYAKHLGLVPVLKRHLDTLCMLKLNAIKIPFTKRKIGKDRKLLLFIDDLDRCNVDHIAKVLDAIRLAMTIQNVIVMIGIDHRIAFKAIRKHYEELADDGDRGGAGEIARDYLGKIIQLPLQLRAATHEELKEYVFEKLFDPQNIIDDTESEVSTERDGEGSVPGQAEPAGKLAVDAGGDTEGQEADNGVENTAGGIEATEKVISEAIKDKKSELKAFYKLVGDYNFSNPRQLLRLHNSFRFLKGYSRVTGVGYSTLEILRMLFWQEFLHNWPMKIRGGCMAALSGMLDVEKLDSRVRVVMNNVKADILKLFEQPTSYQELADFVRIVVLPHNEEGVLDSAEAIEEWLKEDKEKEELKKVKEKKGDEAVDVVGG